MAKRGTREPREMRLVSEYIAKYYPKCRTFTRVKLGTIHPDLLLPGIVEKEKRLLRAWQRWADAIVITKTRLILIEGAILPSVGDISVLKLYAWLLRRTPEFIQHKDLTLVLELVFAVEDPLVTTMAREEGITCRKYSPGWIKPYLDKLFLRPSFTYPVPTKIKGGKK